MHRAPLVYPLVLSLAAIACAPAEDLELGSGLDDGEGAGNVLDHIVDQGTIELLPEGATDNHGVRQFREIQRDYEAHGFHFFVEASAKVRFSAEPMMAHSVNNVRHVSIYGPRTDSGFGASALVTAQVDTLEAELEEGGEYLVVMADGERSGNVYHTYAITGQCLSADCAAPTQERERDKLESLFDIVGPVVDLDAPTLQGETVANNQGTFESDFEVHAYRISAATASDLSIRTTADSDAPSPKMTLVGPVIRADSLFTFFHSDRDDRKFVEVDSIEEVKLDGGSRAEWVAIVMPEDRVGGRGAYSLEVTCESERCQPHKVAKKQIPSDVIGPLSACTTSTQCGKETYHDDGSLELREFVDGLIDTRDERFGAPLAIRWSNAELDDYAITYLRDLLDHNGISGLADLFEADGDFGDFSEVGFAGQNLNDLGGTFSRGVFVFRYSDRPYAIVIDLVNEYDDD